ncbi:MAG: S8 family serine peptidase [Gemmatimonadaceae bacterium]|nr:S8 family serine peptidase [Chitinophagaceae bacterium]
MILRKAFFLFIPVLSVLACQKDASKASLTAPADEDCVQLKSLGNGDTIPGQYIVLYQSGVVGSVRSEATVKTMSEKVLLKNNISKKYIRETFAGARGGFIARLSREEARKLASDENIDIVEPDRVVALSTCFTVVAPRLITWNIDRVGYGDGTGKKAWVIDSGIDFAHPDLTVDKTMSKSFISSTASADDENGHGTHVAGVIAAKNNSFGVLGVASGATLVSLRVLDKEGKGTLGAIIQALAYINANASTGDVVNMSIGEDEGVSEVLDKQVQATAARGILIAIAAGNDHEAANKFSPGRANASNIFTVSAVDSLDNFASFSNYGNDVVDFAAPGVRILSTYMGSKYAYMSGTSMAAPHLAGLLLLKGKNIISSGFAKNDPDGEADPIAHY